jgi:hypothetical protein
MCNKEASVLLLAPSAPLNTPQQLLKDRRFTPICNNELSVLLFSSSASLHTQTALRRQFEPAILPSVIGHMAVQVADSNFLPDNFSICTLLNCSCVLCDYLGSTLEEEKNNWGGIPGKSQNKNSLPFLTLQSNQPNLAANGRGLQNPSSFKFKPGSH